jgi:predicted nuclease of restriction endonuclease-like (RecB) superfamily
MSVFFSGISMTQDLTFHQDKDYKSFLDKLKIQIKSAQFRAAMAVNQEAIKHYWQIGIEIIEKQQQKSWGSSFIETLSHDLRNSFPETRGYSAANLRRMRRFAEEYPSLDEIRAQAVRKLPWGHIIVLIQRVTDKTSRDWYVNQVLENGWSRPTLEKNIGQNLYHSQTLETNKASNFLERLPSPQSVLAQEILKSPYNFDFLGLHDDAHEREIEHASIAHITKFLLELGKGFAFVGRQYPIEVDGETFFIDILMYHLKLRSFVVCELKATKFKPEHTGQLNFYLNLVDSQLKTSHDSPSIGLLLCKSRSKVIAEYALKGIDKPIGVSEYQLTKAIPDNLKANLPSIEEIEAELNESEKPSSEDDSQA